MTRVATGTTTDSRSVAPMPSAHSPSPAGFDQSRLSAKGYGKRRPMARGNTESARQQNRRVEMKIME